MVFQPRRPKKLASASLFVLFLLVVASWTWSSSSSSSSSSWDSSVVTPSPMRSAEPAQLFKMTDRPRDDGCGNTLHFVTIDKRRPSSSSLMLHQEMQEGCDYLSVQVLSYEEGAASSSQADVVVIFGPPLAAADAEGLSSSSGRFFLLPASIPEELPPASPPAIFPLPQRRAVVALPSDAEREEEEDTALKEATFGVIDVGDEGGAGQQQQITLLSKVLRCLRSGTIPVLALEAPSAPQLSFLLPLGHLVDWDMAVMVVKSNQKEVFISSLPLLPDSTLLFLLRQGRLLWRSYFRDRTRAVDAVLAAVRHRRGFEPPFHKDIHTEALEGTSGALSNPTGVEEGFFSFSTLQEAHFRWNQAFYPWAKAPVDFRPWESNRGFAYEGVSSSSSSSSSRQGFTVVTMTYKRTRMLSDLVAMFDGVPDLKAIVIVWNDVSAPLPDPLLLPLVSSTSGAAVPVRVVSAERNTLNNRFLPLDLVTTDCVFQVDDDTRYLTKESITHGFRVWQENRHRLVGFMGRTVTTEADGKGRTRWKYDTANRQQQSLLLTTAMFHHKYYLYRYSYEISPRLRQRVDELMNCEDIFMNAVAQDLTGNSALMCDASAEYSCTTCGKSAASGLHYSGGHYEKRDACIRDLSGPDAELGFGYMPLVPSSHFFRPL